MGGMGVASLIVFLFVCVCGNIMFHLKRNVYACAVVRFRLDGFGHIDIIIS